MNYWLLIIPFLGALSGWLLHFLVSRLFFYPRKPLNLFGISIQGIIPKYTAQLARRIGTIAGQEFLNNNILEEKINDSRHLEKITPLMETHIDEFLRVKLVKEMPMIGMFIGDKTVDSLKKIFLQEIGILFPQVIGQFAGNIKAELNVAKLVEEKIAGLAPERVEKLIRTAFPGLFRSFCMLGALTGFIIGVIMLLIFLV